MYKTDTRKGSVILVGGGPGDPGLLTVRAREAIESAEVVLFDRLVGNEILDLIPPDAEKVDVGKSSGRHTVPQDQINELIMKYAKQDKRVVRLKGGDPYLFGRGAEELEAVIEAGIPFEVVPGISSSMAVPAYAGIPVTHREMASSVHIITGHPRAGHAPIIPYDGLVKLNGTLVFLMGVGALPELTEGLIKAGMNPETPAALIENGTRPEQRRLVSTVAEIAVRAREEAFRPPSVFIVGEVCSLAESLDWYSHTANERPLRGMRVLVTRPKSAGGALTARLRTLGADVADYPCIRSEPLEVSDEVYENLGKYGWIVFTSPVGAELFFENISKRGIDIRSLSKAKFAAVGAKTARSITGRGIIPELVPDSYNARTLSAAMLEKVTIGERILLYRAKQGSKELFDSLWNAGCIVEDAAAYETLFDNPDSDIVRASLKSGDIDLVTFTSASTVSGFVNSLPDLDYSSLSCVCIGEETAAAAREHGFSVIVSDAATIESMVERVLRERVTA